MPQQRTIPHVCEQCGTTHFVTAQEAPKVRFCSRECFNLNRKEPNLRACIHCGKTFSAEPARIANGRGKFCSLECSSAFRKIHAKPHGTRAMATFVCEACGVSFLARSDRMARWCSQECHIALKEKMRPEYIQEDRGYVTPCWIWQGAITNGYGQKAGQRAHRIFYEHKYGTIPNGLEPDHLCKQKACVNPDHLEPVTHSENVRRGPHTLLDWEKVREIRKIAGDYTRRELGQIYGVTPEQISHIVLNKQWRE